MQAVVQDPLLDRFDLAGDRVLPGLLLRGNPGVHSRAKILGVHGCLCSHGRGLSCADASLEYPGIAASWLRSLEAGRCDGNQSFVCTGNPLILEPRVLELTGDEGRERGL